MKIKTFGIVLVIIGALMMIYTGFNYITNKRVANLGPLKIDKEENHPVRWSPIVGGVLLLGGIVLVADKKNA